MKKLLIITGFIFALALYSNTVSAQDFRDGYGHNIGKIESDGTVRDSYGHNIGKIYDDGTVRDGYGHNIGKIYDDGTVRDGNGHNIGSAKGLDKRKAALMFFFHLM